MAMGCKMVNKTIWMTILMSILAVAGVHADDYDFKSDGQLPGTSYSTGVAVGYLNNDGRLDIFVANSGVPAQNDGMWNTVWLQKGDGSFEQKDQNSATEGIQGLGFGFSTGVALGDLDNDGDVDAFVTNNGEANRVWLNNGDGTFYSVGSLGSSYSTGVALGDLDNDGDLDAFVVNINFDTNNPTAFNIIWLNDGSGNFTNNQELEAFESTAVALADFDEDGDLDAFVTNTGGVSNDNTVWRNNGDGTFLTSYLALGSSDSQDVALADINDDGYMDAVVANMLEANTLWRIDGPPSSGGGSGGGGWCFIKSLFP